MYVYIIIIAMMMIMMHYFDYCVLPCCSKHCYTTRACSNLIGLMVLMGCNKQDIKEDIFDRFSTSSRSSLKLY